MHKNQLLKSLMAVVLGLLAGFLLMLAMGFNPIDGYTYLFKGGQIGRASCRERVCQYV